MDSFLSPDWHTTVQNYILSSTTKLPQTTRKHLDLLAIKVYWLVFSEKVTFNLFPPDPVVVDHPSLQVGWVVVGPVQGCAGEDAGEESYQVHQLHTTPPTSTLSTDSAGAEESSPFWAVWADWGDGGVGWGVCVPGELTALPLHTGQCTEHTWGKLFTNDKT